MKNLVKYTLFALVAVTLTGCIASDFEDGTLCRDGVLSISVSTSSAGTRGEGPNDDMPAAESIVKDLQYFLYVKGSGDTAAPIYAGTITDITDNDDINNDADRPDTPADEDDNFSKTVQIPASALNRLFPNGSECEIYIIANYLDNTKDAEHLDGIDLTKDLENATRKKLKAIKLNTTFYETPTSFVMDSEGKDIVSRGTTGNDMNTLTSKTIYLTRAAAKVMIEVNVQNTIDVSGNIWEPITNFTDATSNKMFISFYNGVTTGVIDDGTDEDGSVTTVADKNAYYMVENVQFQSGKLSADGATGSTSAVTRADESTSWVPKQNFYSYANSWTAGDEEHEPYFKISIPWRKKADGQEVSANWVTYTYTVPIGMKYNRFDRNKLYLIRLTVGALGDLNYLDKSVLEFNVLDWNSQDVNVSLDNPRYLVVNEHNYVMNNVEEILIPYSSSNKCEIVEGSLTISQVDLTTGKTKADHGDPCTAELKTIDGKTYIKVYNDLDNDLYSSGFDFTEYNISVSIQHEGNSAYKETVYITQYPAIYGTACENSDYSTTPINDNRGYVWTNGYTGTSQVDGAQPTLNGQTISNFGESGGIDADDDLDAKDMYVITVSATQGTKYVVGDPRKRTPENSWNWGTNDNDNTYTTQWYTANNLEGESQKGPQFYYPTAGDLSGEANNPNYNMLAPKFRVCSAYGAISASQSYRSSYGNVKGRCASYQEDGYPAGRWRLPTAAEFELINVLSNKGLLPTLYVTTMDYWSAHGYGRYTSGEVDLQEDDKYKDSSISVRCVYDDWYWGSEPVAPKDQFTWGDTEITWESTNLK